MKARLKRLWRKHRREQAYTISTPATPAGDTDTVSALPLLTLADTLPTLPRSRYTQSQEVLTSVSQAYAHFSDVSEVSDPLKHVDVEFAGVGSFYDENDATNSDFGDLMQHSPVPSVTKSPGFAA